MPRKGTLRKNFLRARRPRPEGESKHLHKLHVKKDDTVEVLSGVDKGKQGKVLQAFPGSGMVVVQGINSRWKHLRRSQKNPQGGRVRREAPIHASNVMPIDSETNRPTRIRSNTDEGGGSVMDRAVPTMGGSGKTLSRGQSSPVAVWSGMWSRGHGLSP